METAIMDIISNLFYGNFNFPQLILGIFLNKINSSSFSQMRAIFMGNSLFFYFSLDELYNLTYSFYYFKRAVQTSARIKF